MKRTYIFFTVLIAFIFSTLTLFSQSSDFLQQLTNGEFRAKKLSNIAHLNDGARFAAISEDGKKITASYYASTKTDTLFNIEKIEKCPIDKIFDFEFSQNEQKILVHSAVKMIYRRSFTTEYYIYDVKRSRIEPLSENGAQQMAAFSPNGRIVAFARDNNLFLKKLDFGTETQITKDGKKNEIINGTPDWVYEEEFTNICYFTFSPDSKLLAFLKFDEKEVQEFSFQWFNDTYPTLETFKYPKAGTANSRVSLWVYDVENRTTTQMKIDGDDFYIPTIKWTATADALAAVKLSRNQKQIDLLSFNPRSGIATKLYSESSQTYSDYRNLDAVQFLSDNSFVILSEKSGLREIYLHEPNGIEKQRLTKMGAGYEVTDFYGYDETNKTLYFQVAEARIFEGPIFSAAIDRYVYSAKNGKFMLLQISKYTERGIYKASFSADYKFAIMSFENSETPNIFSVINNSGKTIRKIFDNNELKQKFDNLNLPKKDFYTLKNSENQDLNYWLLKPKKFDKNKKYPLVMVQYSGPDSQEVLNGWKIDWEYFLAENGFVVACVDGRGTGGHGRDFRTCTYGKLGVLEAQDQIAAANYFAKEFNFVDKNKIAIWGWSYGGFMTLMCMTSENNPFAAGIAIAPVTDWSLYNTAYTERFMNRPQENFAGYDENNLLSRVENLTGNLLLIHGTADDNVHTQNTYLFAEKLVENGKQFDMQLYTNKNHSILGAKTRAHLYTKCVEWLKSNFSKV
ncbi:MAG: S9 family peptidase [Prevotellaceae bacterium]|jgi:dipeptidyl-peptidase-4|nr:S9 family peptidase [Prevotellaceae bacterium]